MNSRVKIQFGLVVLGAIVFFLLGSMTQADEVDWASLKTEKFEIQAESSGQGEVLTSYPAFLQILITRILNWDPKKELNNSTPTFELLKNLSVDFDLSEVKNFRKVWFHLNPKLKVRGLFGIHDFIKPRPFIILRMGIHGNVDEMFAERFIAKAIYEDLDANFLVLESLTSHAFLSQNAQVTFGGTEEGLHTFLILHQLQKTKFKKLIKSTHLIGVSLGGQGTFVTSLLDQANDKQIKSILNFCPLINLQETFERHAESGLKNAAVDLWNFHRMETLYKNYEKQLSDVSVWKVPFDFQPRFTPQILKILNAERKTSLLTAEDIQKQFPEIKWPQDFYNLLTKSNSFYELNYFWKLYQNIQTPMMIYTTPNDPLVFNELNSEMIFNKKQAGDFKQLQFKRLDRGIHCGLAPIYPWTEVVKMIQTGLLL
jgi:hypothetical protein